MSLQIWVGLFFLAANVIPGRRYSETADLHGRSTSYKINAPKRIAYIHAWFTLLRDCRPSHAFYLVKDKRTQAHFIHAWFISQIIFFSRGGRTFAACLRYVTIDGAYLLRRVPVPTTMLLLIEILPMFGRSLRFLHVLHTWK